MSTGWTFNAVRIGCWRAGSPSTGNLVNGNADAARAAVFKKDRREAAGQPQQLTGLQEAQFMAVIFFPNDILLLLSAQCRH